MEVDPDPADCSRVALLPSEAQVVSTRPMRYAVEAYSQPVGEQPPVLLVRAACQSEWQASKIVEEIVREHAPCRIEVVRT